MLKLFNCILFVITISTSFGQVKSFEGKIKSRSECKPISDVHLFDKNGYLQAVTDQHGYFNLYYGNYNFLIVSCLGF